jgi:hypothetical protein
VLPQLDIGDGASLRRFVRRAEYELAGGTRAVGGLSLSELSKRLKGDALAVILREGGASEGLLREVTKPAPARPATVL